MSLLTVTLLFLGCATGNVQTSTGIRPAAEVQAQNAVGDVLQGIDGGYRAAVAAHDAAKGADSVEVHARDKAILDGVRAGLVGALRGLAAWKTATSGGSAADVLSELRDVLPAFLELAVRLDVLDQAKANAIAAFVTAVFR